MMYISIHALREEGDIREPSRTSRVTYFYPRPPRGGRLNAYHKGGLNAAFLSTPSARRATHPCQPSQTRPDKFLSTPSARRATLLCVNARYYKSISIHALREEGDRTAIGYRLKGIDISIHALREEGDVHDSLEICVT